VFGLFVFSLAVAIGLFNLVDRRTWLNAVLEWRPMVLVGLISYALYLWHYPVLVGLVRYHAAHAHIYGLVLSFALAISSYYLVERPFLRLKARLRQERPSTLMRKPVSIRDAVISAVRDVAPEAESVVQVDVDPTLTVDMSRESFDRIIVNLVSNALHYGQLPVSITAKVAPDLVLTVEDHGRGVSPEFVPRLFEPFTRSHQSEQESPGLGLGLAVAQMTASEIGGTLAYEPAEPGARFRLTLPRTLVGNEPIRQGRRRFRRHLPSHGLRTATLPAQRPFPRTAAG
jgi:signal transduction histidine kinase